MTPLMGYRCADCNWIGLEPSSERTEERDGLPGPYRVSITDVCPECRSYDLDQVQVCRECEREVAVEGFDYGYLHLTVDDESEEDFRRDQIEPVAPPVRKEA